MNAVHIGQLRGRPRNRPAAVVGDKGYSSGLVRQWLQGRGIRVVIPRKSNEHQDGRMRFDRTDYRRRHVIECCVGWLKECRRVATRFEKLAINFLAMVKLAIIQRYLKSEFSDSA